MQHVALHHMGGPCDQLRIYVVCTTEVFVEKVINTFVYKYLYILILYEKNHNSGRDIS